MPYLRKDTDAPFGLAPYSVPLRVAQYTKASTTNIFAGDLVEVLNTGLVRSIASQDGAMLIVGVSAETTVSASAGTTVMVYDHPDQLYTVQDDDVGTAIAETHIGNSFLATGLTPGTAAQVTRGRSITEMDTSTANATVGVPQPLQFIRLHEIEGASYPAAAGSPRKVVVKVIAGYHLFATQSGVI